jgi:hypothetical protein
MTLDTDIYGVDLTRVIEIELPSFHGGLVAFWSGEGVNAVGTHVECLVQYYCPLVLAQ